MRKIALLHLCLAILAFLTGCWDKVDIERRGYVLGAAIDLYSPEKEKLSKEIHSLEKMELHVGKPKYVYTIQLPIIKRAEVLGSGNTGGGSPGSKTWDLTQIGNSISSMNREVMTQTDLLLTFEHLKAIIISEETAREGLEDIIDFFVRDPTMIRRVKIFISEDAAVNYLKVTPKIEDYASIYISTIPNNSLYNSKIVSKTDLGEVINNIHAGNDFLLPKIIRTKEEVKISGGALFKGGSMKGWLGDLEVEAVALLQNTFTGGVITAKAPNSENGIISLDVTKAKSKITPQVNGDNVSFNIKITIDGDYAEGVDVHTHGILTPAVLKKYEKQFEKEIEKLCKNTIEKVQNEYGTDVFQFKNYIKTKKPAFWKSHQDKWDDIFPEIEVNIEAKVNIVLIGTVK